MCDRNTKNAWRTLPKVSSSCKTKKGEFFRFGFQMSLISDLWQTARASAKKFKKKKKATTREPDTAGKKVFSFVIFFRTFKLRQRARVLVIETGQDTKMSCKKAKRKSKTATKTSREKQSKKRRKGNVERSARSENKNLLLLLLPTTTPTRG
jgi:hypothetical protein